jgi:hypothetical protein
MRGNVTVWLLEKWQGTAVLLNVDPDSEATIWPNISVSRDIYRLAENKHKDLS